jgi:restriction system protein
MWGDSGARRTHHAFRRPGRSGSPLERSNSLCPIVPGGDLPQYSDLLWPGLVAVRNLGGVAKLEEIDERVIQDEGLSEEQLAILHKDGPRSEVEYRLAWARTYLKSMGLLANPSRGTWVITDFGKQVREPEIEPLRREYLKKLAEDRKSKGKAAKSAGADPELGGDSTSEETDDWREELLQVLLAMDPGSFEHLAKRLLRAAGFINASVTGGSGDGGIDGVGVYRLSLVSFPVYFQCKRYKGTVGPDKVRDFRGAMAGRGDKGLLITTGNFTAEATKEATRDGAPPIDLIDGERLCNLLKEHQLGVETTQRTIEEVAIHAEFFQNLS